MNRRILTSLIAVSLFVLTTPPCCAIYYTTLDKQIALCETFLASDTDAYPEALMEELNDAYRCAIVVRYDPLATQSQVISCASLLKTVLAAVQAQEGFSLSQNYVCEGTWDETSRGFVHPGLLHTQEDLDRVREQLAEGDEFVTSAYEKLKSNVWAQSTVTVAATEKVIRGSDGQNYTTASRAANAAYMNALRWQLGDGDGYARNAVSILNDWAATCTEVTGNSNYALAAGLTGHQFANAAELLRDFSGWDESDFTAYKEWMRRVWYEANIGFLRRRNGTWENESYSTGECPGHYWSNWGLCNVLSAMSIAILCDAPFLYNQAVSFYKYNHVDMDNAFPDNVIDGEVYDNGCNEFIGLLVPALSDDERGPLGRLGQMQESGRDQAHAALALGLAVDICQTAFNQGDDLFAYMDHRLTAGIEWHMAFNTQDSLFCTTLPWTTFHTRGCRYSYDDAASVPMTEPAYTGRYAWRAYNERILGYYEGIKGISMPYTTAARDSLGMEEGGQMDGTGDGHLGLTTLTCHRPAVTRAEAPAELKGIIVCDGDTMTEQTELGGLKATYKKTSSTALPGGSLVTLIAEVPDSLSGTGSIAWSTGEEGCYSISVEPVRSGRYFAWYTNEAGVESTLAFTIAVKGDCIADSITPTVSSSAYDTTTGEEAAQSIDGTSLSVLSGASIVLKGSAPSALWGYYTWETGVTADSIQVEVISSSRDYTLIYTNPGGAQTRTVFHIDVVPMQACLQVDSGDVRQGDAVAVFAGQKVSLIPRTTDLYSLGEWAWYDAEGELMDTVQTLVLDSVQEAGVYSVVHTFGDLCDTLSFRVQLAQEASLPDGQYYIFDAAAEGESLLSVYSTMTVRFSEWDEEDPGKQVWDVELDTTVNRYKFSSAYNGRVLNGNGRLLASSTYKSATCSFTLWEGVDQDLYAVQTSSDAGGTFWWVEDDGETFCVDGDRLDGFPFGIVAVEEYATSIDAPPIDDTRYLTAASSAEVVRNDYYSLSGVRLSTPPAEGICLLRVVYADGHSETIKRAFR